MKKLVVLFGLLLCACGGGAPITNTGPVTVDVTVDPGAVTCSDCTIYIGESGAASSPSESASSPTSVAAVPLPVPQTNTHPFLDVCAGCLQWTSAGAHFAVIFRDIDGTEFASIAECDATDCTPGPNVWYIAADIDSAIDLDFNGTSPGVAPLPDFSNASLEAYAQARLMPALALWLAGHPGMLAVAPQSVVAIPTDTTRLTAFERLTAIFDEHVRIGSNGAVSWAP